MTNPLGPGEAVAGPGDLEDHIPTEPIYKLVGLAFAVPSTLLIAAEGMANLTWSPVVALLTRSRDSEDDGRSSWTHPGSG